MSDRGYCNADLQHQYVESLVYSDKSDWKKDIVQKNELDIRIMTYNVHGFTDRKMRPTFDEILDIIQRVNPDILVIEEFVLYGVKRQITYPNFKKWLQKLGFITITTDRLCNNVLASKFQGDLSPTLELGRDPTHRIYRFASTIKIAGKTIKRDSDLVVVGTHLDVYDELGKTRINQANLIVDCLEDMRVNQELTNDSNSLVAIVTGDFNCLRRADYDQEQWAHIATVDAERGVDSMKTDAVDIFERADLVDASVCLDNPITLSVWANRRVDYICGRGINFKKAHTVQNACSDHYAMYADFSL